MILSTFGKRFYMTKMSKHLLSDISAIGPYRKELEATWIVNMLQDKNNSSDHSGFSYMYTETITNVITNVDYTNWKTNHIHLSFDDMFLMFYMNGFLRLGTKLISTPFNTELIKEI
jgi:hypothetical protein